MKLLRKQGIALGMALALVGCAAEVTPDRSSEAAEEIRQADIAFDAAFAAGDEAAFRELLADDAVFFGDRVVEGGDAVAERWMAMLETPGLSLRWEPTRVEAAASGELGYSIGTWRLTLPDEEGGPTTSTGHYVTLWRRGADGRFRAEVDIGSEETEEP